jgi:hypothetical protein
MLHNEDPFACFDSDGSDVDDDDHIAAVEENDSSSRTSVRRLVEAANARQKNAAIEHLPLLGGSSGFEVFDDPISGKGLRALRKYACGDEIIREGAAMRVRNQHAASSAEDAKVMYERAVQACFDALSPATQRAVMDLSSCEQSLDANGGIATPLSVIETNSFRLGEEIEGGLFLTVARINHSCRPNCNHIWRPDLQATVVFATKTIEIGEELCTTYGPSECLNTAGRRAHLRKGFSFDCMCQMCLEGNMKGGDDRMLELNSLQEDISLLARTGNPKEAMHSVEQCLKFLDQQGIGTGVFVKPILHYGYQISLTGLDDKELARSYLARELIAVNDSEGVGCYKSIDIQLMLDDM